MQRLVNKLTAIIVSLLLLVCVSCSTVAYKDEYYSVFGDLYASLSYYGGTDNGVKALAEALDNEINPDIPTSYVARFNAMDDGEIEVSKNVYDLVNLSKRLYSLSGGAFDITLSDLSKLWKVDHESLDTYYPDSFPALPSYEDVLKISSTMDAISTRKDESKYYLSKTNANAKIDLGGIAKGYLSDLIYEKLKINGVKSAIIDVSGNLCLLGKKHDNNDVKSDWKIGVNNCFDDGAGTYLCGTLIGGDCSVITSGTYERGYEKDGVKVNHLINPHTKMPVGETYDGAYSNESDYVISVTVIGENGAICDAVATAVCVMGINDGANLIEELGLSALVVTADKKYKTVGSFQFMQGNFYLDGLEKV